MALPKIDKMNINKPLCYDAKREKFISFEEITSHKEEIINIDTLPYDDRKILIIERLRRGPDFTMQSLSGMPLTRDDVVNAIINDEEIGKMCVEAEVSMLKDLLKEIATNL